MGYYVESLVAELYLWDTLKKREKGVVFLRHIEKHSFEIWKVVGIITSQIWSSAYCWSGSTFARTVPWKRVGSWGMIPNLERKSLNPKVTMSTPSITMRPPEGSTSRNKAWMRVDLPLPVLPTTPTFSPPEIVNVMPFNTIGVVGRYRNCQKRGYEIQSSLCSNSPSCHKLVPRDATMDMNFFCQNLLRVQIHGHSKAVNVTWKARTQFLFLMQDHYIR